MKNTPFLLWLRTIRPEDMSSFRLYLQQPQNTAKKLPCSLFEYLRQFEDDWRDAKNISSPHLTESAMYAYLYPHEPIKPQRLRRVMMELREMIESFAATVSRSILRPSFDHALRTLQYLLERDSPLFPERLQTVSLQIQQAELAEDIPLAQMHLEQMRNQYLIHHRSPTDTLEALIDHLDEFYLMVKLETWTSMRFRESQFNQVHRYSFAEEINVMASVIEDRPMVLLWQAMFRLVHLDNVKESYPIALSVLESVRPKLLLHVLRQARAYLFNSLMRMGDTSDRAFFLQLHELLYMMLQEGTLHLPDGRMPHTFYLPYVRAACLAGHFRRAATFIQDHSHNIVGPDIEGLIGYCRALVAYHQGEIKQSSKILVSLKSNDLRTEAQVRILHVQVAYSIANEDTFFRLNEALRKFLIRHPELGERFQTTVKRFTHFVESLARVKFKHNPPNSTLRGRIQKEQTAEKLWLLEQAKVLIDHQR